MHPNTGQRRKAYSGQLKECVWAGCLYNTDDERIIKKPLSPKLKC